MQHDDANLYGIFVGLWVPSILSAYRVIENAVSSDQMELADEQK